MKSNRTSRIIFRSLLGVLLLLFAALVIGGVMLRQRKEEVKAALLEKVNSVLVSSLKVDDISINILSNFPNLGFALEGVRLDKTTSSDSAVASLDKIDCAISLAQLLKGHLEVRSLTFQDGYIDLRIDSLGNKDFDVVKKKEKQVKKANSAVTLDLDKITLKNITFRMKNDFRVKDIYLTIQKAKASIHINKEHVTATLRGAVFSHCIKLKDKVFVPNSPLDCDLNILFLPNEKTLSVHHSTVKVNEQLLNVKLFASLRDQHLMKLQISHSAAAPEKLVVLLPTQYQKPLSIFQLGGKLNFDFELNTSLFPGRKPYVSLHFKSDSLLLTRKAKIDRKHVMSIDGDLFGRPINDTLVISVALHKVLSKVNGQPYSLKGIVRNVNDPWVDLSINAPMHLEYLKEIFSIDKIQSAEGQALFDLRYTGNLKYLSGKSSVVPKLSGRIVFKQVKLKLQPLPFAFTDLNGVIRLENDNAYLDGFKLYSGHSDMQMTASLKNMLPALLSSNSFFELKGEFLSNNLILDDFIAKKTSSKKHHEEHKSNADTKKQVKNLVSYYVPSRTAIDLKAKINTFKNKRLIIKNATLNFSLNDKVMELSSSGNALSGSIKTAIKIDARNAKSIKVSLNSKLNHIDVNRLLYEFDNFGQALITTSTLKGVFTGDIGVSAALNQKLELIPGSAKGKVQFEITKGRLINFAPLVKANNVLTKGRALEDVSFEDIHSVIHITDDMIKLDRMVIASSAGFLYLEGMLDFKNNANFLITVPMKTLNKNYKPKPEELHNDSQAGLSMLIRIEGPLNDLKVKMGKPPTDKKGN